jgi:hypothetical protein
LELSVPEEVKQGDSKWQTLRDSLKKLLEANGSLGVIAKAEWIRSESDRVFINAQIFTDIRSVFPQDPDEQPKAAVIIHNLRIRYAENGEAKQLFLALSDTDVEQLRSVLNRADQKTSSIKSLMAGTEVPILEEQDS